MATFEDILRTYSIEQVELNAWIEQRWVRPLETPHGLQFDDVDQARITLIRELRQEFMVNDDALGIVLSLLDQVYAARRALHTLEDALSTLPEPLRREVLSHLRPRH